MDKLERMLKHLPRPVPAPDLAGRILLAVHRRHARQLWLRRGLALVCALSGLLLASPAFSAFLSGWNSPATPWLADSLDLLVSGSPQGVTGAWQAMLSLQSWLGASLEVSIGAGLVLLTTGLFFGLDRRVFQSPLRS